MGRTIQIRQYPVCVPDVQHQRDLLSVSAEVVERYNRTVRTEWLGRYHFETIEEVQDHATRWLWTYNNERSNMGIGGVKPIQKLKAA
jgi:transposase InsO family protein